MRLPIFLACAALAFAADRVALDNDSVRILDVTGKTSHQSNLNRVIVSLDGHVTWAIAGTRDTAVDTHIVEIELKKPAPPPAHSDPAMDPVHTDPKHNTVIFENAQVRVFRSWREPGASETMHSHPGAGRVAVFLTDVHAIIKTPAGAADKLDASAGEFRWSGPITHVSTNTGPRRFDMIIVEVK